MTTRVMQLNNYYTFFDYLSDIYHEWLASLVSKYEVDRLGKFLGIYLDATKYGTKLETSVLTIP